MASTKRGNFREIGLVVGKEGKMEWNSIPSGIGGAKCAEGHLGS